MKNYRDSSLDAIGGLFIIYMIIGHAFQWSSTTKDLFYKWSGYFLPMFLSWFFFKSGMFYKRPANVKSAISKWTKNLLIPYLIYSIVGEIVFWIRLYQQSVLDWRSIIFDPIRGIVFSGSLDGNMPLWFLLSLFLVKVVVATAEKYKVKKKVLFLAAIFVSGGGTILIQYIHHIPCTLLSTALGVVFYLAGAYLRDKQYNKSVVIVSFLIFFALQILIPSNFDFRADVEVNGYWMVYVISSLTGIIVINNLFKWKFLQLPFFTSIGRNSMDYYCFHWILFSIVCIIFRFNNNSVPNYRELYILLAASILVLPCYSYWKSIIRTSTEN